MLVSGRWDGCVVPKSLQVTVSAGCVTLQKSEGLILESLGGVCECDTNKQKLPSSNLVIRIDFVLPSYVQKLAHTAQFRFCVFFLKERRNVLHLVARKCKAAVTTLVNTNRTNYESNAHELLLDIS